MGAKTDIMTAEDVRDALKEQIEQKFALLRQLQEDLKGIEAQIDIKRAQLPIGDLEIDHADL